MNFFVLVAIGTLLVLTSCKNRNENNLADITSDTARVAAPYFPVASFIKNEVDYVDSLPVGIKRYLIKNDKVDSGYISVEEFHKLAAEFSAPELNDSAFRKGFVESSFYDKSSENATFFYKASDPAQSIQRIDVVTMKGDVYDEVKSIYIEKNISEGQTVTTRKMFWKPKRNFQIITIPGDSLPGSKAEILKVVWDNRE